MSKRTKVATDPGSRPVFRFANGWHHNVPDELLTLNQWVTWRYDIRDKKWTKVPFQSRKPFNEEKGRTAYKGAKTDDPATWGEFWQAVDFHFAHRRFLDGVGFVFSADDPYTGWDIDNCLTDDGTVKEWAKPHFDALAHGYFEVSPSGRGIKGIVRAKLPGNGTKKGGFGPEEDGAIELYDRCRFFTITGNVHPQASKETVDRSEAILGIYELIKSKLRPKKPARKGASRSPGRSNRSDDEILQRARRAKNGTKFAGLFDAGDISEYPSQSEADLALLVMLAYWTGNDTARMEALFDRSALGKRAKWTDRQDYRQDSIANAIELNGSNAPESSREGEEEEPKAEATNAAGSADGEKETQAQTLLRLAEDATLFHTPDGKPFATIPVNGHRENHPIRSTSFKRWMVRAFYEEQERPPQAQALNAALGVLESQAEFDGPTAQVSVRVANAGSPNTPVYLLDLGDPDWTVAMIDSNGWQVMQNSPPVKFRRAKGMLALPIPQHGGSIEDLRKYVNVPNEQDWRLIIAWLSTALRPMGPYPILALNGEQGSAKSTTSRSLRRSIDPHVTLLRCEPKEIRDLMIAATNTWAITHDNISYLQSWMSDALCRLATGGGFATRTLYENNEETHFDAMRPVLLNGIEDVATRFDLLDRCIVLSLPMIPDNQRREEEMLWREFESDHPRILGALLDAVAGGIRELPEVKLDRLPRMADFARWGEAVGRGLGWEHGAFLKAYEANRDAASEIALEASAVALAIRRFMEGRASWEGTATDLLAELTKMVGEEKAKTTLPPKPNALSGKLKRATPALRKCGINVTIERHNRVRTITLTAGAESKGKPSSPSSLQSVESERNCQFDNVLRLDDQGEVSAEDDRHGLSPPPAKDYCTNSNGEHGLGADSASPANDDDDGDDLSPTLSGSADNADEEVTWEC
jgi:primase-polymerase (primpol)-like protein